MKTKSKNAPAVVPGAMSGAKRLWLAAALALALHGPAHAVQPDEVLPDAALETRAREISAELRCLVCQNQSIDDSDAPLARDLRLLVRERLKAGDSNTDVKRFLVERYGDFVLLRPPFNARTALLWLMPVLALAAAAGMVLVYFRRAPQRQAAAAGGIGLSSEEEARLAELLRDAPASSGNSPSRDP